MTMRRILIILGVLLLIVIVGVAIFFLFFNHKPGVTTSPGGSFGGAGNVTGGSTAAPDVGVPVGNAGEEVAPKLIKITDGPVALGSVAFDAFIPQVVDASASSTGSTTPVLPPKRDVEVRYVERASGNIYRFRMRERTLERLTNQTLPGIQEASWTSDGTTAFVRFLAGTGSSEHIETYALSANGSGGYALQQNLSDVIVTGTSTVLTVLPSTNGSIGTTATIDGASPKTLFSSLLSSLTVRGGTSVYAAYTKPSAQLPGYAFSVSKATGEFTRLLGPLAGLAVLPSPSGTSFLYSFVDRTTLGVGVINPATYAATPLPIATFAEKCVWSADSTTVYCAVPKTTSGTLPDAWYQGAFSSSDRLWKIDMESRVASLLFDPSLLAKVDIDAVSLAVDPSDDALTFTNRKDGSLWLYDL